MTTINCSVPPNEVIEFVDDCLEFEDPMKNFIKKLIKE